MALLLLLISPLLSTLAILLIQRGLYGRRIGDHPMCRKCGFDLFGKPADSKHCSECGTDLTGKKRIVIGIRNRRPGLAIAGFLLLIPVLAITGGIAWSQSTSIDWTANEPTYLLIWQANSADSTARKPLLKELKARARIGQLSDLQWKYAVDTAIARQLDPTGPVDAGWGSLLDMARAQHQLKNPNWKKYLEGLAKLAGSNDATRRTAALADLDTAIKSGSPAPDDVTGVIAAGLDYQGDTSRTWEAEWGDVLQGFQSRGQLTDAQWNRYVQQAWLATVQLKIRSKISRSEPFCGWIENAPARLGSQSTLTVYLFDRQLNLPAPADPVPIAFGQDQLHLTGDKPCSYDQIFVHSLWPAAMNDGLSQVKFTAKASLYIQDQNQHPKLDTVLELPGTFTLVPANSPTVKMVSIPGAADHIRESIHVDHIFRMGIVQHAAFYISVQDAPMDLSFDVWLRQDGKETWVGWFACATHSTDEYPVNAEWPTGAIALTEIILRSNPRYAAYSKDVVQAWQGQVNLGLVPVR